jgi:hypothetical protein
LKINRAERDGFEPSVWASTPSRAVCAQRDSVDAADWKCLVDRIVTKRPSLQHGQEAFFRLGRTIRAENATLAAGGDVDDDQRGLVPKEESAI